MMTDFGPFNWIRNSAGRQTAMKLVLKALRERWGMSDPDREKLRAAMEWLRDSGAAGRRDLAKAGAILAHLEVPEPALA